MDRTIVVLMILAGTLSVGWGANDQIGPYRVKGHDPMMPVMEAGLIQALPMIPALAVGPNGYTVRGRDPMVTMIVIKKEILLGIAPQTPVPQAASLADFLAAVGDAGRWRDFKVMFDAAEQGLNAVAHLQESLEADAIPAAVGERYHAELIRYASAAREGILQDEAMAAFVRIGLVLEGVMWDEAAPVAVIKGEARCAGDTFLGVRVVDIKRDTATVAFTYVGREFRCTLGI
ncbi:MAG: hypothetical protein ABIF71_12570 [Planctomycetota bacterium]